MVLALRIRLDMGVMVMKYSTFLTPPELELKNTRKGNTIRINVIFRQTEEKEYLFLEKPVIYLEKITLTHRPIYIYVCVCVCVCVY